jgi:hypothetical protein
MADTKISALSAIDAVADGDLLAVVDDPGGTPVTKRATAAQIKAFVVAAIVDSAPGTLDTLNELAAALGDDEDFAGSVTTALAAKLANVVEDTTPQLGGQLDVNGNALGDGTAELLKFSETASAVNELTAKNAATGNAPELQATGDDINIDLKLTPKGTGGVKVGSNNVVNSPDVAVIDVVTQAEYDALTPVATTLYVVIG